MEVYILQTPRKKKRYGFWHFMLDLFLIHITGGLWFFWLLIRFLRSNTR